MLKDLTSARALPSMSPLITVNLCHTHRQVTVAVQAGFPSLPAAVRMIHLQHDGSCPLPHAQVDGNVRTEERH